MTVNLFPLCLMNFMFHTMLDAAGIVLRVHYKSIKCDFLFSQGSVRTLFRRGGHFSYMSKKISSSLQQCKNYKNRSRFPKVMITNVLPPFLWFTAYNVCRILSSTFDQNCPTLQRGLSAIADLLVIECNVRRQAASASDHCPVLLQWTAAVD